jgi:hypothetical protein
MTKEVTMSSTETEMYVKGLRRAETIRNLDERSAMKIAMALAGASPELFDILYEVTRLENVKPQSSLTLNPPGLAKREDNSVV